MDEAVTKSAAAARTPEVGTGERREPVNGMILHPDDTRIGRCFGDRPIPFSALYWSRGAWPESERAVPVMPRVAKTGSNAGPKVPVNGRPALREKGYPNVERLYPTPVRADVARRTAISWGNTAIATQIISPAAQPSSACAIYNEALLALLARSASIMRTPLATSCPSISHNHVRSWLPYPLNLSSSIRIPRRPASLARRQR